MTMQRLTPADATALDNSGVRSEQRGAATMLLAGGETARIQAGDVVRTPAGALHGLTNGGAAPFVYLTATTPPIDLRPSYRMAAPQEEMP